jgi:hypothetical protein
MDTEPKRRQVTVLAMAATLAASGAWLAIRSSDAQAHPVAAGERSQMDRRQVWPSPRDVQCGEWAAWENHQPPERARLIVTAECILPTPGHTLELRPHIPQGFNPRILLLDLVVHAPKGPTLQVLTPVQLRYEQPADGRYDSVAILPDGLTVDVEAAW